MTMRTIRSAWFAKSALAIAMLLSGATHVRAQIAGGQGAVTLPPGDGKEVVAKACNQCHGLALIAVMRDGRVGWQEMVDNMILRGAQVKPDEAKVTIDYLFDNFGPSKGPMPSPKGSVLTLPEGAGKQTVESHCVICHDAGRLTGARRSATEWEGTVKQMMHWADIKVTPDEMKQMTSYLTTQFGKKE